MFEALIARVRRVAERRAREKARLLAEALKAALPRDIHVEADEAGARLSGRALRRRLALDPALRWAMRRPIR